MMFPPDIIEKLEYLGKIPTGAKISLKYLTYHIGLTGSATRKWYRIDHKQNLWEVEALLNSITAFLRHSEGTEVSCSNKLRMMELLEAAALGLDKLHQVYIDEPLTASRWTVLQNRFRALRSRLLQWPEMVEESSDSSEGDVSEVSSSSTEDLTLLEEVTDAAKHDSLVATTPIVKVGPAECAMGVAHPDSEFDALTYQALLEQKYRDTPRYGTPPASVTPLSDKLFRASFGS